MYTQDERQFFAPLEQECFEGIEDIKRLNAQFAALDTIPDIPHAPPVNPDEYNSAATYGYDYCMQSFVQLGYWLASDPIRVIFLAAGVLLGVVFSQVP